MLYTCHQHVITSAWKFQKKINLVSSTFVLEHSLYGGWAGRWPHNSCTLPCLIFWGLWNETNSFNCHTFTLQWAQIEPIICNFEHYIETSFQRFNTLNQFKTCLSEVTKFKTKLQWNYHFFASKPNSRFFTPFCYWLSQYFSLMIVLNILIHYNAVLKKFYVCIPNVRHCFLWIIDTIEFIIKYSYLNLCFFQFIPMLSCTLI